jgi:hypothetical protein
MKKIFTLSTSLFAMLVSFADFAPSRLVVNVKGDKDDIKVIVDENRFSQQVKTADAVFDRITPGCHTVSVYVMRDHRSWFGRDRDEASLLYKTNILMKPMTELSIRVNRRGRAILEERTFRGGYGYNNGDDDNDRRTNDGTGWSNDDYNRDDNDGRSNSGYATPEAMNNADFYAAKRMVQREKFDENRLVVAKHIADVNYMTAAQVKEIAVLFSFDSAKLEFSKYAYRNTVDRNNYFMMYDMFASRSSKEELANYTRNFR